MSVLYITIPISLLLVGVFIWLFVWSVNSGQMDKLESKKNIIFNKSKGKNNGIRK
ncbi:MAG: cbb3-type cytochrome oxidase assembly protein CcoS [Bdellovibrionales bacterium]|nr:cbb3-type cytochrome oxidase assembly protein CcoS [Bdellovibrionales bacterium]